MLVSCFYCWRGGPRRGEEAIRTYHARQRRRACNIYRGQGAADKVPTHHCRRASPLLRPSREGSKASLLPHSPALHAGSIDGSIGMDSAKCQFAVARLRTPRVPLPATPWLRSRQDRTLCLSQRTQSVRDANSWESWPPSAPDRAFDFPLSCECSSRGQRLTTKPAVCLPVAASGGL